MKIGSLFSGYGGLDLGVQAVLGGEVAWHVELDPAPSRILAHRFPGVPNYGDVTKVDWAAVEPVDVLTGGFPCQDVSLAGLRKGLRQGTRSGLWSEFAQAIGRLRPGLVVIENVRGLLSAVASRPLESDPWGLGDGSDGPSLRALGAVLGDLADLGYDARWCGVRAADAGAPHGRFRVFIIAYPAGEPWRVGDGDDVRTRGAAVGRESDTGRGTPADAEHVVGNGRRRTWDRWPELADGPTPNWGAYRPAVERWGNVLGRSAPTPTEPSGRAQRLSPRFVEWMMGLSEGWVTAPDVGLTRTQQLKALGNGVVPQQASLALTTLLTPSEVLA